MITDTQFQQLKDLFLKAADEVQNNSGLSDWLMDFGGSLISLGVQLADDDDEEDEEDNADYWKR